MNKVVRILVVVLLVFAFSLSFVACKKNKIENVIPEDTETDKSGMPILKIYNTSTEAVEEMNIEEYLLGVVAGEMYSDFEIEALKAQAILARTYAVDFIGTKQSKYEGADISNDIVEAQAYSAESINDKIREAVYDTKGCVAVREGELIDAWFHANSGGVTATAGEGFGFTHEDSTLTKSIYSPETEENSQNFSWSVILKKTEILDALRKMGVSVQSCSSFSVGQVGESGRAITFSIGGKEVSANTFRINVGSMRMKSTLIKDIRVYSTTVYIEGLGYGHGVGMSQWGANVMAQQGKTAEEIIKYYFEGVEIKSAY